MIEVLQKMQINGRKILNVSMEVIEGRLAAGFNLVLDFKKAVGQIAPFFDCEVRQRGFTADAGAETDFLG